jgi:phage tail-like protein
MNYTNLINPAPPLSHRFGVFFFATGVIPNPIDIRFQKVSGLNAEVNTDTINEGGQNLYTHRIPTKINYNNLVLEKGIVTGSPLHIEFNSTLSFFRFAPSNVMVTLFSETSIPIAGWLFMKAYPVKWSIADFDANANAVVIETMELAYTRFQIIQL